MIKVKKFSFIFVKKYNVGHVTFDKKTALRSVMVHMQMRTIPLLQTM